MLKKYGITCLILISSYLPFGSASAVMIGFSPSSITVNVGDTFDVDVVISDLFASGEIVSTFDLDVTYDAAILNATAVSFGSYLDDALGLSFQDAEFTLGRIDFSELSFLGDSELQAIQVDSFTLATLSFEALAAGVSSLFFDPNTLPGVYVIGLDPSTSLDLSASIGTGDVRVAAVKVAEPSILFVMITGWLGFAITQRKRFKRLTS
ncbi:cohesin domain-containing protein [uncultured Paraglaciecola sp.]|jgi:hypothetical protein|uniref:cohesin domain-containing protein n=1 Tax=uncultured Paraglaciecola sp. TaxID=1765024 RepID=UPI0026116638|nr:cohesin domain-containing protein [uncultured Paraglaciecola sp.]